MTAQLDAAAYARALVAAGFDAEAYYSGGGIMVVNVVTRRGDPRPVRRGGVETADLYADPLDYLTLGEPTEGEPWGYDLNLDGEYAEESGGADVPFQDGDLPATIAWLRANLARVVAEGRCPDCGNARGWHPGADWVAERGLDPGLRDGLGCVLYPYVPDRPGITRNPAAGVPARAVRP